MDAAGAPTHRPMSARARAHVHLQRRMSMLLIFTFLLASGLFSDASTRTGLCPKRGVCHHRPGPRCARPTRRRGGGRAACRAASMNRLPAHIPVRTGIGRWRSAMHHGLGAGHPHRKIAFRDAGAAAVHEPGLALERRRCDLARQPDPHQAYFGGFLGCDPHLPGRAPGHRTRKAAQHDGRPGRVVGHLPGDFCWGCIQPRPLHFRLRARPDLYQLGSDLPGHGDDDYHRHHRTDRDFPVGCLPGLPPEPRPGVAAGADLDPAHRCGLGPARQLHYDAADDSDQLADRSCPGHQPAGVDHPGGPGFQRGRHLDLDRNPDQHPDRRVCRHQLPGFSR